MKKTRVRHIASRIKGRLKWEFSVALSMLKLKRIDRKKIPLDNHNEIRLFTMVRNESLRLPYFIEYYFAKGVDRIFLIDNGSDDGSIDLALSYENVHVFHTSETFKNYNNWTEILLNEYGKNHWCVAVDADEILFYPYSEMLSIKQMCEFLDKQNYTSIQCLLLDMYSNKPIHSTDYRSGMNPLSVCSYFDPSYEVIEQSWMNHHAQKYFQFNMFTGNMRRRVFGRDENLSKFPLFKYGSGVYAGPGRHALDGTRIADIQGVVFHFKYLYDFNSRVLDEVAREQHAGGAASYKVYARKIIDEPNVNAFHEGSVKFQNNKQLIDMGLMKTSVALEGFVGRV
jgi:hypothetical protein